MSFHLNKSFKNIFLIFLLFLVLLIPSYWRMLKPGIFTMHDFHVFRLYEYDKCIKDGIFPCRWAPDSAFEYGQPMFNYYAQLPYLFGEVFRVLGFSVIDSIKLLFIFSLILSALSMYFLSRQLWQSSWAGVVSAIVYVYAPYRAVDVYVRGALPEALAFVFFPLILYFFNSFVQSSKVRDLLLFSLSFTGLILVHNLSALMFLFPLTIWGIFYLRLNRKWNLLPQLILSGLLIFLLTAFYILPVVAETQYITLQKTAEGYYDYRSHYVTLNQLLLARYWGYGASLWGEDDRLSLSVGHLQWILPLLTGFLLIITKRAKKSLNFYIVLLLGWLMLLLTHNKSTLLWLNLPGLSYVQFPWRFLTVAVFSFALASGMFMTFFKRPLLKIATTAVILSALIALNMGYFFEDLWQDVSDKEFFSGSNYEMQVSSALSDFWPIYGKDMPNKLAPDDPWLIQGEGTAKLVEKRSHSAEYKLSISSQDAEVVFPIVSFPGWQLYLNDKLAVITPEPELGLISTKLNMGEYNAALKFENTSIRTIGNSLSLLGLLGVLLVFIKISRQK